MEKLLKSKTIGEYLEKEKQRKYTNIAKNLINIPFVRSYKIIVGEDKNNKLTTHKYYFLGPWNDTTFYEVLGPDDKKYITPYLNVGEDIRSSTTSNKYLMNLVDKNNKLSIEDFLEQIYSIRLPFSDWCGKNKNKKRFIVSKLRNIIKNWEKTNDYLKYRNKRNEFAKIYQFCLINHGLNFENKFETFKLNIGDIRYFKWKYKKGKKPKLIDYVKSNNKKGNNKINISRKRKRPKSRRRKSRRRRGKNF